MYKTVYCLDQVPSTPANLVLSDPRETNEREITIFSSYFLVVSQSAVFKCINRY